MTLFLRGVAVAVLLLLFAVVPAYAHAELEESDPADGETITTPYTLTATFSEEFDRDRSFIRVRDAAGELVAEGGQDPDDPNVMVAELPVLDPGIYTVQWQTTTPDDNGVERDTFTFNVAEPVTAPPTRSPTPTMASTPVPTMSARPPTATPTVGPAPAPTPTNGGPPTASGDNILLALGLAAVVLLGVGAYVFTRRR